MPKPMADRDRRSRRPRSLRLGLLSGLFSIACAATGAASSFNVTPISWSTMPEPSAYSPSALLNLNALRGFDARIMAFERPTYEALPTTSGGYLDFGGIGESEIRPPAFTAYSVAVSVATGAYSPTVAGVGLTDARGFAVDLSRSVAASHRVNTSGGFGNQWQSALWAASAGYAGWLLWDDLSIGDRDNVARMVEYEADRFLNANPPDWDGSGGDSKTEENSWNATVLDLAVSMMPGHRNASLWFEKATEYRVSATAVPADVTSGELLHGVPLSDWTDGFNVYADGSVINHNIHPHPTYAAATIKQNGQAVNAYGLAGLDTPSSLAHNLDLIYDNLVTAEWSSPPYRSPGGTIYQPDGTIYWPGSGESNRRHKYYLFAAIDRLVDAADADTLSGTDAADWEALHWEQTLAQLANPDGPNAADGIAGYNPPHSVATSWLSHYLGARDAIRLSDAPLDAWPLPEPPRLSTIDDVVLVNGVEIASIVIDGQEIPRSSLINGRLTDFRDADAAQITVDDGSGAPAKPSDLLRDWSVSSGLANFDEIVVTLDQAVYDVEGAEIVIVDVGSTSDQFSVTINGTTRPFSQSGVDYTTERFDFDIYESTTNGATNSVSDLDGETFVSQSTTAESNRVFKLLDLADFGLAPGEAVTDLTITNTSGAFDTMAVFAVLGGGTIGGDYNGDGYVDAADFVLMRDSMGGDAAAHFWPGSRNPTASGPIGWVDHTYWASQLGNSTTAPPVEAIPEPTTAVFLSLAALLALRSRRS